MITCCKNYIESKTKEKKDVTFWNYEPVDDLIMVFNDCIELNTAYRTSFSDNCADNDLRNNNNFDFDENETSLIFSLFDSFKRKLIKLIEVFLIKKQIAIFEYYDIDEKNIESLEAIVKNFERGNEN